MWDEDAKRNEVLTVKYRASSILWMQCNRLEGNTLLLRKPEYPNKICFKAKIGINSQAD